MLSVALLGIETTVEEKAGEEREGEESPPAKDEERGELAADTDFEKVEAGAAVEKTVAETVLAEENEDGFEKLEKGAEGPTFGGEAFEGAESAAAASTTAK